MSKGIYGILNGMDGAGKGAQFKKLLELFPNATRLREPGGTIEAEVIRSVILEVNLTISERLQLLNNLITENKITVLTKSYLEKAVSEMNKNGLNGMAEAYLYAASRSETNQKLVKPTLASGGYVFAERSVACSMAYQGHARGLGQDFVWDLNSKAIDGAMPTFEIFLDVPPEIAQERLRGRTEKQDRLDQESFEFHLKTREGYMNYFKNYCPYDYYLIDASGTIEEVHKKVIEIVQKYI